MSISEDDGQTRAEIPMTAIPAKSPNPNHQEDAPLSETTPGRELMFAGTNKIAGTGKSPNPNHKEDALLQEAEASLSEMMFRGTYEMARTAAMSENKWLLINLQSSTKAEASLALNKTWRSKSVIDTIRGKFVFWQDEDTTEDGICFGSRFTVESLPVVMLIEPYTSSIRWTHVGFVQPAELLENLGGIESNPLDFCRNYDLDLASALGLDEMSLY